MSMNWDWSKFTPVFFQLVMQLPALVQTAEVAFSGAPNKSGEAKRTFVMGAANALIGIYQGSVGPTHQIPADQVTAIMDPTAGVIRQMIDTTVATLKVADALTHPPVAVLPVPTAPPLPGAA